MLEGQLQLVAGPSQIYAAAFTAPEPTHFLLRGSPQAPRQLMAPGMPASLGRPAQLPVDTPEAERRLALGRWITDPGHPLTGRVLVNRLWQQHFGQGLVRTPSDLGVNGARPSHPELLDWLASEFVAPSPLPLAPPSGERGWRMKPIHRLMLLSSTYRQASIANPGGLEADAESRLLWRFPPRRLEAEAIRDAVLGVSGNLDLRMGGPGFDLFEPNTNYVKVYTPKKEYGPAEWRRMIYQSKPRMRLDDVFGPFDCPDAGQIAPRRTSSATVLQAVSLLNSPFMLQQARLFADRLRREAGTEVASQVHRGFWLAFQREPDAAEAAAAAKLIEAHGLAAFCRALFNVNEFLYVY
jgi:hypothetical protein